MRRTMWFCAGLAAAGLLLSLVVWGVVPNPMPIHWDASGAPNGFAPRWLGLTLMPAMTLGLPAFITAVAKRSPKQIGDKAMATILIAIAAFNLGVHGMVIQAALRPDMALSMGAMFIFLGLLFVVLGWIMPTLPQNPFAGVRTPWTLADEANWSITHRFARWTMMGAGIFTVLFSLVLSPPAMVWVSLGFILIGSLSPAVLSYVIHRIRQ